jgi:hypothetical protein
VKVLTLEEFARLLYYTDVHVNDYPIFYGIEKPDWSELDQGSHDDYRQQAGRILENHRIGAFDSLNVP